MFKRSIIQPALLIATMLLATACTAKAPDADVVASSAAPVVASSATEAVSAASVASDAVAASVASDAVAAPASSAASTAVVAAASSTAAATSKDPVEGTDYTVIDTPDLPIGDKVQVTEIFGYGCPHCAAFQPYVSKWEKSLPADVQFSYMPAAFGADPVHCWDTFARAFYAAKAMGVQAKSQDGIYKEVFDQQRLNGCQSIPALYADYGVDTKVFASTMQSFAVSAKLAASHEQTVRWGVDGTPTVVIDGKYRVVELVGGGPEGMLHTIDWLIAKQRPLHKKH